MDRHQNAINSNFDLLNRLKSLSFLSPVELRELASSLHSANFSSGEITFSEEALATGVHFVLRGVAKITCLNRSDGRVTVALLAPGPIPEFLSSPVSRWHFRCEAYSDCRIGRIGWDQFDVITKATAQSALRTFHENNLMQWYRWSLSFLGLDLRERLVFTLRQLCSNFGVAESRGTLLRIAVSHKDLADLVGASRPRVTEHLAELEREHVLIRQGRQLIVCLDKIENLTNVPAPDTDHSWAEARIRPYFPKEDRLNGPRPPAAATSMRPPTRKLFASPGSHLTNRSNAHSLN
jgi:CRP/FNR family transcriptional regulator